MGVDYLSLEESWREALKEEFTKPYFDTLISSIAESKARGVSVFPPDNEVFKAFEVTPFDKVKVVIIGQDPYHRKGQAMGLSFSVPRDMKVPPSLKRIYKEIHEYIGCAIPNHGDLTYWAEQGVLLLNAALTVEEGNAGSHAKIGWQYFTDAVIKTISDQKKGVCFLLWGNFAKAKGKFIDKSKHTVLESAHPSPLAGNAFFGNHHFSKVNEVLSKQKQSTIDWQIV